jgi:hypothetical protein
MVVGSRFTCVACFVFGDIADDDGARQHGASRHHQLFCPLTFLRSVRGRWFAVAARSSRAASQRQSTRPWSTHSAFCFRSTQAPLHGRSSTAASTLSIRRSSIVRRQTVAPSASKCLLNTTLELARRSSDLRVRLRVSIGARILAVELQKNRRTKHGCGIGSVPADKVEHRTATLVVTIGYEPAGGTAIVTATKGKRAVKSLPFRVISRAPTPSRAP